MANTGMRVILLPVLAIGLALPQTAAGASEADEKQSVQSGKSTDVAAAPSRAPVYRPPSRGKPRARVGGAVRGARSSRPTLTALVPEHTGLTVSGSPSLFWYLDVVPQRDAALVFTLTDEESVDPVVETALAQPEGTGIQRIDLAALGVELSPEREYQWSVALVIDAQQRARDIVAVGYVLRVDAPVALAGGEPHAAREYAAHGLWYDALTAASDRVHSEPESPEARRDRDGLLRQAGLEIATGPPPR
jgi:hypothetical protein